MAYQKFKRSEQDVKVTIRGEKCRAPPFDVVKAAVSSFLRKKGLKDTDTVNKADIKREDHLLFHQLSTHGYVILLNQDHPKPTNNPSVALEAMGFKTKVKMSLEDAVECIRGFIPETLAEKAYRGELQEPVYVAKRLRESGRRGIQAYGVATDVRRSGYSSDFFKQIIDRLYPGLATRYKGTSLYDALRMKSPLSSDEIGRKCREWFFAGEDLMEDGLRQLDPGVAAAIEYRPSPGELHLRKGKGKRGNPRKRGTGKFPQKVCEYAQIPDLTPTEIISTTSAQKTISLIFERELLFLLHIAQRYDPTLKVMGREFRDYLTPPLTRVVAPDSRPELRIENGSSKLEADGRVVAGGLETLVEVKGFRYTSERLIRDMREKYASAQRWEDGTTIKRKIALLNCSNGDLSRSREILEGDNWKVMDGEQFTAFYERALRLLMDKEPDFWRTAAVPLTSVDVLLHMHELVSKRSHLLGRRSQGFAREWLAHLLKENANALATGTRVSPRREYDSVYVEPFSRHREVYGDNVNISHRDCLFFDLETAGFRNQGFPIFVLGMAYKRGRNMVTDLYLVRDPTEEKEALLRFKERAQKHRKLVSFNGGAFDEGFLRERFIANLIPYDLQLESIDLYPAFREFARRHHFPRATLQTYEGTQLGFRRHDDVPGSKIPQIYRDFVYGRDDTLIPKVIHHNQMDLITMTLMYEQFYGKKR